MTTRCIKSRSLTSKTRNRYDYQHRSYTISRPGQYCMACSHSSTSYIANSVLVVWTGKHVAFHCVANLKVAEQSYGQRERNTWPHHVLLSERRSLAYMYVSCLAWSVDWPTYTVFSNNSSACAGRCSLPLLQAHCMPVVIEWMFIYSI